MNRLLPQQGKHAAQHISVSPLVLEVAELTAPEVLRRLDTSLDGLGQKAAESRLEQYGPNVVARENRYEWLAILGRALINPLIVLLTVLTTVSFAIGDTRAGIVTVTMIVLGVALRLVQETRADSAAAKLKAMMNVTATVLREGQARELPLEDLVPGDVVKLSAGDMIPADVRLVSAKDLFVTQASLTGESFPVEKFDLVERRGDRSPLALRNICYLGSSTETGAAVAVVVATGWSTYLGSMSKAIAHEAPETSFDRGVRRFTWLMIRFIVAMVPLVFLINGLTKHDWRQAFFFAVAVAVGLTPEMLPMIVSNCLAKGAILMAKKKVIVKRLDSIQNFGAMDILCTDKTGTLTLDQITLELHCDVMLREEEDVLALAYLNSHFQTGLRSALDRAVLRHTEVTEQFRVPEHQKIDEIPFDFSRRLLSVVVRTPEGRPLLVTKGAPEEVYRRCTRFELEGCVQPMDPALIRTLRGEYEKLSSEGFRVLALAYKDPGEKPAYAKDDEQELILKGYVAFLDPPKETAGPAVEAMRGQGVAVKILTGDNELVSRKICQDVGIQAESVLLGSDVEKLTDEGLADAAERVNLFARLSPADKQRIIKALQHRGHVVGFLGDGINDAPALRAADVGISVDSAADVAKESADLILLEKSLLVLREGVIEGRKVFANILKYVRMGASSNFGNMLSVLGASAFLPYVPMAPIQILTNNLLYDFSQLPIPTDEVDPEQVAKPRPWSIAEISRFIVFIGPCSSVFDYVTYLVMLYVFGCWDPARAALFHTGWFVESLLTQTLIIHVIRTNRMPFLQSRASRSLTATTLLIMAIGVALPFSPIGPSLGFVPLPPLYWPILALMLGCYLVLTHAVKTWLHRKGLI